MESVSITRSAWRITCAFVIGLLALAALGLTASRADAASLRVSCTMYAENYVDPIAFTDHLHRQLGNTSTTNTSTADSLYNNKDTSCETGAKWWTNAGWFPVERYEYVPSAIVYYRAPGDQTKIVNIPHGMNLIGKRDTTNNMEELSYNCGASPGDTSPLQSTPPYKCTENWGTHLTFPRCWDGIGVEPKDVKYGWNRTSCPSTHPYMLPEINYLIRHPNGDNKVPNPLRVSMGVDEWGDYTTMHADYFFAAQDEFNHDVDRNGDGKISTTIGKDGAGYNEEALIDLCLREAPPKLEFHHERCRAGGLLSWHKTAINDYYGF